MDFVYIGTGIYFHYFVEKTRILNIYWSDGLQAPEIVCTVQACSKDSTNGTGTADESVPLQRQARVPPPLHPVRPPTPGILCTCLVAMLDGDKDCLERVQKRAVGMISGLTGRTYEDRLKELGIVTLEERRHQMDMLQTYKILNGKEKVNPSCWFTMASDSERVTRQSADPLNIRPGAPRLDIRRYFYSQRVVESWNNVPLHIKKSVSVTAFKNAYRRHRDDMIAPA